MDRPDDVPRWDVYSQRSDSSSSKIVPPPLDEMARRLAILHENGTLNRFIEGARTQLDANASEKGKTAEYPVPGYWEQPETAKEMDVSDGK